MTHSASNGFDLNFCQWRCVRKLNRRMQSTARSAPAASKRIEGSQQDDVARVPKVGNEMKAGGPWSQQDVPKAETLLGR